MQTFFKLFLFIFCVYLLQMELEYSEKYEPLFQLLEGAYPKVDTVIITGGRNSAKSHAVGTFICVGVKDYNYRALYTRYTLTSVDDSIMPEFKEKIKLLNAENSFTVIESRNRINCNHNQGKIIFKGIKTAQGNQTASLKSLKDFSLFVAEEAEELPSFDDWDKVKKSIRVNDVRNLSILILNPTQKSHWIFKEFFESRSVNGGFNGVVGNVMYIHTSYLDVDKKHIPQNMFDDFESKRKAYEEWSLLSKEDQEHSPLRRSALYYKHTLAGGWLEKSEGVIFDNWRIGHFVDTGYTKYGLDFGFSDPTALAKVSVDSKNKKIYIKEEYYKSGSTETELIGVIGATCGSTQIIADSANPMIIEGLRRKGINIIPCVKGRGSIEAGINMMLDHDIIVDPDSKNLQREFNSYCWNDKRSGVPVDMFNHCFVGDTLISTDNGLKPISEINNGDYVLTREGYNKVLKRFDNGKQQVFDYLIQFDTFSLSLCSTDSHLIYTDLGWKKISELQSGMTVILDKSLTERYTNCIQEEDTFVEDQKPCTEKYISSTKERYQRGTKYTTSTKTLGITGSKTLKPGKLSSIKGCMAKRGQKKILNGLKSFRKKVLLKLLNGIGLRRERSGTLNMRKDSILETQIYLTKNAKNARKTLNLKGLLKNSAPTTANQLIEEEKGLIMLQGSVSAEKSLKSINIQEHKIVHVHVQKRSIEDVYDIMVEHNHEYFANGLLAHNCIDASRYAISDLLKPKISGWVV